MESEWISIDVSLPGRFVELAGAVLADLGAGGTLVEERQLDCFSVPDDDLDADRVYRLTAYFEADKHAEPLQGRVESALSALPALTGQPVSVSAPRKVRLEDWAENWKQNFTTMRIGRRLVIHPSWEECQPADNEVAIEIDPGMAFGTGTHGTTLLCLETIAELLAGANPPQRMLDVGTGSGILALGAAALGCNKILANDIDPVACEVARENVAKNDLGGQIEISLLPLEELPGQFDLVVANILAEENIRLKKELMKHLQPGGWLVLSGILLEKEAMVRQAFAELPLQEFPVRTRDEWVCLLYRCA